MRISFWLAGMLLFANPALAEQAVVLVGGDCDYQIISVGGNALSLIKTIEGNHPLKNDVLSGSFTSQNFNRVTNQRSGESLNIWVEPPASASLTMARHTSYCTR